MLAACALELRGQLDEVVPTVRHDAPPMPLADGGDVVLLYLWPGILIEMGPLGSGQNHETPVADLMRCRPRTAWHLMRTTRGRALFERRVTLPSGRAVVAAFTPGARVIVRDQSTGVVLARGRRGEPTALAGVPS